MPEAQTQLDRLEQTVCPDSRISSEPLVARDANRTHYLLILGCRWIERCISAVMGRPFSLFRTLAARLALSLTLLFGLVSAAGILVIYGGIFLHLRNAVDDELTMDAESIAQQIAIYGLNSELLKEVFMSETHEEGPNHKFLRLVTAEGVPIASSDMSSWSDLDALVRCIVRFRTSGDAVQTVTFPPNRPVRVITMPILENHFLQLGIALDRDALFLRSLRTIGAVALFGMLLLGTALAWWIARRAMTGVAEVSRAASRIAGGRFEERVVVDGYGQEIESLGEEFNRMTEKLQTLIHEMGQVNNNIAHDLRSPLGRIRILAESHAAERCQSPACLEAMANVVEDCDRLTNTIDTMLSIAEVEAGVARVARETVDPAQVVREAIELFLPVAEDKNIVLQYQLADVPVVQSDRRRVQRALANLVDNALKYTDAGGEIVITLAESGRWISISVRDNGIGIPENERNKIFDRFYRGDLSRSRHGSGLGLSLARAVARALGGDITVESQVGKGSLFTLLLPRAAPPS